VKDLFDTAGVRTTYGSAVFAEHIPSATAEAVLLLELAGYANVGKTNLHEFAYGVTSQNLHYGTVPNPRFPGRTAGGSSGGSAAALAAGLADAALGSDSGGSIRIPAACCGIVGFKPTYGRVSAEGVFPLAPSFDHAGPMARDVATCVELMQVLALDFVSEEVSLDDLSLAVTWADRCEPLMRERVLSVNASPVEFPTAEDVVPAFMREVGDVHRDLFAEYGELYGENIRTKVERCIALTDAEYAAALEARTEHAERADAVFGRHDLLIAPTMGFVAPAADVVETEIRGAFTLFTFPFNALGWPALSLPAGPAEDGLPASIQVVGRPGTDALVLAAGAALEAALKT
jgi:aspartyl-tRNA(Asn)/glutamyl-tRNA(Gln) amidotransferase subunit A